MLFQLQDAIDHGVLCTDPLRRAAGQEKHRAIVEHGTGLELMDEFFEVATLIQTGKMSPVPLILVSSSYWGGLLDWLKTTMFQKTGNVSQEDLDLLSIADTADEVAQQVLSFYSRHSLQPNF